MDNKKTSPNTKKSGYKNIILIAVILIVSVGIPLLFLNYQANRSGLTMSEVISRITGKSEAECRPAA
jgi:hypothetical protein